MRSIARNCAALAALALLATATPFDATRAEAARAAELAAAAERAALYYADVVGKDGAYAWSYSPDLSLRRGKGGPIAPTAGMIQLPGTPAVGAAFLRLHQATGDPRWLEAATAAAHAVAAAQLRSGGWFVSFETDPEARKSWCYFADGNENDRCKRLRDNEFKNLSMFDDDVSQGALRFLIWYDAVVAGKDDAVRKAIDRTLEILVDNIYPNGACPFRLPAPGLDVADPAARPTASFPKSWSRVPDLERDRPPYYVLNDNVQRDCIEVLLVAERRFGGGHYLAAAHRVGAFLLRAQLPQPQPAWAQTYDRDLVPVWGRTFEPPAIATHESAGVVRALVELYGATGDTTFLDAASAAAGWLRGVVRPDGQYARFHELKTGKPLFVRVDGKLSHNPADRHGGYTYLGPFEIAADLAVSDAAQAARPGATIPWWQDPTAGLTDEALAARVRVLLAQQDQHGAWSVGGFVDSATFVEAIFAFARVLESADVAGLAE